MAWVGVWGEKRVDNTGLEVQWYCARVDRHLVKLLVAEVEGLPGLVMDSAKEADDGRVDIRWLSSDPLSPGVMDKIGSLAEKIERDLWKFMLYLEAAQELKHRREGEG